MHQFLENNFPAKMHKKKRLLRELMNPLVVILKKLRRKRNL
jgi:hypothetical protein